MNFKKAGIFRRSSEGSEQPEVQNDSGGMLAVWGSPGSGKTVTAVKIAKMLSAKKKNIANDILSAVALMEADSVLRLANCDLKSISYFSSQLPLLKDAKWDADKQYKVAANVKPFQAADHIGKVLGSVTFKLPYSQELEEQYLAGNLFSDLSLKDSRAFRKELEKIIEEVF